jgi:transposase
MSHEITPGKPNTRRYSDSEKQNAVRLVVQLRKELGTDQGTVGRVARQLGIGVESLRTWVRQHDIDGGIKPGVSTDDAEELKVLRQEVKELRRANDILKKASAFFAAELDRPQK